MRNITIAQSHTHQFDTGNPLAQKKIFLATIFTAVMMFFEILGGWFFNSMALLADGWHMSSHVLALGLAYIAYKAARYYRHDERFSFGTWKIEILAGYSSAILLMLIAIVMAVQSIHRLFNPITIHYNEAILIAIIGLAVNLVCAWLLHGYENPQHGHTHHHEHSDLNQKAAYIHVIADALTSVLAIIGLFAAKYLGWIFLDAFLGVVGAVLVGKWSIGLLKAAGKTLLDAEMDHPVKNEILEVVTNLANHVKLVDLHLWKVGRGKFACILALESHAPLRPEHVKKALAIHEEIVHVSVEINPLSGDYPP